MDPPLFFFFFWTSQNTYVSRTHILGIAPLRRPPSMKPGAESPVIYDFIRRYTIRSYLKVEAFFTPAVQATLNDRISTVSAASRGS